MANFWDNISNNHNVYNKNNFNLKDFIKFAQEMKGQDPNLLLQDMINKGQITQEQLDNAKAQANGILQMIQNLGIKF